MKEKGYYTVLPGIVVIWGRAEDADLQHTERFYHEKLLIKRLRMRRDERAVRATLTQNGFKYLPPAQFLDKIAKMLLVGTVARPNDIKGIGKLVLNALKTKGGKRNGSFAQ